MRLKQKRVKKQRLNDTKRALKDYCALIGRTGTSPKYLEWQKRIDKEKLIQSLFPRDEKVHQEEKPETFDGLRYPSKVLFVTLQKHKEKPSGFCFEEKVTKEEKILSQSSTIEEFVTPPQQDENKFPNAQLETTFMMEEESNNNVLIEEAVSEKALIIMSPMSIMSPKEHSEHSEHNDLNPDNERSEHTATPKNIKSGVPEVCLSQSFQRLQGLSESIQKSVNELNERLNYTKSSVTKFKASNAEAFKSLQPMPQFQDACVNTDYTFQENEYVQVDLDPVVSKKPEKENQLLHRLSDHIVPSKPLSYHSAQKESAKSKEGVYMYPERICSCKLKSNVLNCSKKCEVVPGNRSVDRTSWLTTSSDVEIKLNKAERLRMEFIRKKSQTPSRNPISYQQQNSSPYESWSAGKLVR